VEIGDEARRTFVSGDDARHIGAVEGRQIGGTAKLRRRLPDLHAPPSTRQPFRFGGLFGIDAPLATKGETGAALAGFAVFGLRASLLPRRWDLAIYFSCWRRRAPQPLVAPLRRAAESVAGAEERHGRRISRLT
jgi:hypothetical protein